MRKKIFYIVPAVVLLFCLICCIYLLATGKGRNGVDGTNGINGRDGADGERGADGVNAEWLFGSGAPLAELGKTGDCYLDLDANAVYQKTANGWEKRGDLSVSAPAEEMVEVTFNADGGTLPKEEEKQLIKRGSIARLPVPTRQGYRFLGWFYGEGVFAAQANALTAFTDDIVLTAHWIKSNSVTVKDTDLQARIKTSVTIGGNYDGSPETEITVLIAKGTERLSLADAADRGWIMTHGGFALGADGSFEGYIVFGQAGEYNVILSAQEGDFTAEAVVHVQIEE